MADPLLEGKFPEKDLNQAVAIAAMCLQDEPSVRPLISDVVTALGFIVASPDETSPKPIVGSGLNSLDVKGYEVRIMEVAVAQEM